MSDSKIFEVDLRTVVDLDGFSLELGARVDIRLIPRFIEHLREHGIEPPPKPIVFEKTAEGLPICPRHGIPMKRREKQGDVWFNHKLNGPAGEELYCRGYPGPDSPGYYCQLEGR